MTTILTIHEIRYNQKQNIWNTKHWLMTKQPDKISLRNPYKCMYNIYRSMITCVVLFQKNIEIMSHEIPSYFGCLQLFYCYTNWTSWRFICTNRIRFSKQIRNAHINLVIVRSLFDNFPLNSSHIVSFFILSSCYNCKL